MNLELCIKRFVVEERQLIEGLSGLSKGQLMTMVMEQMKTIERLQQQNEDLLRRLKEHQRSLEELERLVHRGAAPFRVEENKRVISPKKPGQKGQFRTTGQARIEETIEEKIGCCSYCSGAVQDLKDIGQIIEEIPEVQPKVYRVVTQSAWCPHCHRRVYSHHPLQTSRATGAARVQLGPRAKALVLSLRYEYGLTQRKVSALLNNTFQLPFSAGGVVHSSHRSAQKLQGQYESLCTALRDAPVVHSDETS